MQYYQILVEKRLPGKYLTYASNKAYNHGQVVKIPIRGKYYFGIIISEVKELDFDPQKVKEISEDYPVIFSKQQIDFLFSFAYNTFNHPSDVLAGMIIGVKNLNKGNLSFLREKYTKGKETTISSGKKPQIEEKEQNQEQPRNMIKPSFILDSNILLRIMYLIRSNIYINSKEDKASNSQENSEQSIDSNTSHTNHNILCIEPKQILILFPEKKLLDKIHKQFISQLTPEDKKYITTNIYTGANSKQSREAVLSSLSTTPTQKDTKTDYTNQKINIIFAARSGLFLPFKNLSNIMIIDEANSFYIQDQNSLYYDARDASFMLSQAYSAQLTFISNLPSIRLLNFYSQEVLDQLLNNNRQKSAKSLILQLSKRERNNTFFDLFSTNILEKIGVEYKVD